MKNIVIALTLSLFMSSVHAQEREFNPKNWFMVLPEAESLKSEGDARDRELNPELIRALVWNIKKTEMPDWEQEFTKYGKDKDLLLVQEAFESPKLFQTFKNFFGFQWEFGISFIYLKQGDAATGTMIGSNVEPSQVLVKHSPDTEPVLGTPKSVTFAKYPLSGKHTELLVVSVHAINFETTDAFVRHIDQITAEIARHHGPVLFAGDFNTWNPARTSYLETVAKGLGMKEASYINGNDRMDFHGNYLDHVFSKGLTIKKVEVRKESKGSDHKPLLVELSVP